MTKLRVTATHIKVAFWIDDDLQQELKNLTALLSEVTGLEYRITNIMNENPTKNYAGTGIGNIYHGLHNLAYHIESYYSRVLQYNKYGTLEQFYDILRKYLDVFEEGVSYDLESFRADIEGDKKWHEPSSSYEVYEAHQILKDMGLVFGAIKQTIDNIRAIIDIPIDVEEPVYSPA